MVSKIFFCNQRGMIIRKNQMFLKHASNKVGGKTCNIYVHAYYMRFVLNSSSWHYCLINKCKFTTQLFKYLLLICCHLFQFSKSKLLNNVIIKWTHTGQPLAYCTFPGCVSPNNTPLYCYKFEQILVGSFFKFLKIWYILHLCYRNSTVRFRTDSKKKLFWYSHTELIV